MNQNGFTELDEFDPGEEPAPTYRENNLEDRLSFRYILNRRFNRKLSGRSGFTIDRFGYRLDSKGWKENDNRWEHWLNNKKTVFEGPNLYQAYSQAIYKFSDQFEIKPGIHLIYFGLNDRFSVEPRFGASWKTSPATSLNFGYGKHSKVQSMATYFIESVTSQGEIVLTNKNLGFTKTHHMVLGFDALLSQHLRFKTEAYYQYLFDVPVEKKPSYFSILNTGASWGLNTRDNMFNGGEGWNYGVEFTVEKFYHKNYYFLTTLSLFDSKYTGSDEVKRNTAFNGKFVFNALAGREFVINSTSTLVFDARLTWAGGKRYTPIDIEALRKTNEPFGTEYHYDQAYSQQFPDYVKADVKIGFRKDRKKVSQLWEFYVENVTNHKNPLNHPSVKAKMPLKPFISWVFSRCLITGFISEYECFATSLKPVLLQFLNRCFQLFLLYPM
ncbi:MAG TPA: hypothetical protein ENN90_14845 [Mariniphaga anaerophila]|uniref:TonB-dependent receptor-like beta-barrel domain-containing protein n=1 Tax=Mariniphaga anaerophila TaxID=1484053 RepID=A0A831LNA4_9BACT|nr:hypothetical protein [Mariniphaga anaerophila]